MLTAADLIAFERDIADCFNLGEIRAPVHLDGGNENQLIDIFSEVLPDDWVLGSWRMHYKCLLKGVPPERLKADIIAGKSITLCYSEYRVLSSAIAGQIAPWAAGLAAAGHRVHCFLGDMTSRMGVVRECMELAQGVRWIIEDNGLSVCTPTKSAWDRNHFIETVHYRYKLPWPHHGAGVRVAF